MRKNTSSHHYHSPRRSRRIRSARAAITAAKTGWLTAHNKNAAIITLGCAAADQTHLDHTKAAASSAPAPNSLSRLAAIRRATLGDATRPNNQSTQIAGKTQHASPRLADNSTTFAAGGINPTNHAPSPPASSANAHHDTHAIKPADAYRFGNNTDPNSGPHISAARTLLTKREITAVREREYAVVDGFRETRRSKTTRRPAKARGVYGPSP